MLEWVRFALAAGLTCFGAFVLISSVLGVFRFRYALSRIHAAALVDTLGILTILAGLMVATGFSDATLKMMAVIVFLWLTSPVSSHLIGKLEITVNSELEQHMRVLDAQAVLEEKEGE